MAVEQTNGWGAHVLRELESYNRDETFVTVWTRSGREIVAGAREFEIYDGWPTAVWRLGYRFIPEPEIVEADLTGPPPGDE